MYKSYELKLQHAADFRVHYRFYSKEEGGRQMAPFQGYRSDFFYEFKEHPINSLFMIWPEFEDEERQVILDEKAPVPLHGTARMWIIVPENRLYHAEKITMGIKGYFMEGKRRVAECTVIEILGLLNNPTVSG